jgi:ribonuclease R
VPIRTLPWDKYQHDETHHCLRGDAMGLTFTMGQRVKAELLEAESRTGSLVFELVGVDQMSGKRAPKGGRHKRPGRQNNRRRK